MLPKFALCAGVLLIGLCCDCLTVSLSSNGFWVAFWVQNTLYECLVLILTGTLVSFSLGGSQYSQ